ncbi:hypothetical protein KAU39_04060 [bacterium]|nr:hypothetical protein [bacterium]
MTNFEKKLKYLLFIVFLFFARPLYANFEINGATVTFNNNTEFRIVENSGDIRINNGAINCSQSLIFLSGNWENQGSFNAGTSTVTFENNTTASTVLGNTTFYNLACQTAGKTIFFTTGSTQTVTNLFTLTGATGNLINLRSSVDTQKWYIDFPNGNQTVDYINVKDSDALHNTVTCSNSTNSGNNNSNWIFGTIISISVSPSGYDFGVVLKTSTNVATSSITVTNDGNVNERYSLQLAAPTGWICVTDTVPGIEEFRMCGNFQTATAQSSHFVIGGSFSDAIYTTSRVCSTGDFSKDDEGEGAKGYNVPSGQDRYLWFRFESPTSTGLTTQQTITVTITAEEQP